MEYTDEPDETLPPADEPEGGVELTPPDADGELTLPVAGELTVLPDGELVLMPVPLVAPVLGAPVLHAPVLKWDLGARLARPLDFGATVRGRRLFGDNKTWRGALVITAGVVGATVLLSRFEWFRDRLPDGLGRASQVAYGALLGAGVVLGELPNSFLKRQLGIQPGGRRWTPAGVAFVVFDQADFVLGVWVHPTNVFLAPLVFVQFAYERPFNPWTFAIKSATALAVLFAAKQFFVPPNVQLTAADDVVLLDFGIAIDRGRGPAERLAFPAGSPAFVAPEVFAGAPDSPATDLFALGVTLFCAVEGHLPFPGSAWPEPAAGAPPAFRYAGALGTLIGGLLKLDPRARLTAAEAFACWLDAAAVR